MEVKNPFLFTDEDYGVVPERAPPSVPSNPFLLDDAVEEDTPLNPFFSAAPYQPPTTTTTVVTNPFAFDPTDYEDEEPANIVKFDLNLVENETFTMGPPPIPPKSTQDLLLTVMGEMDATSTTLLDKIPPTRTPSPVSIRDLNTPEPQDFLLVDVTTSAEDLVKFDLEVEEEPVPVEKKVAPPPPPPPARPAAPPSRPPPPKPVAPPSFAVQDTPKRGAKVYSRSDIMDLYSARRKSEDQDVEPIPQVLEPEPLEPELNSSPNSKSSVSSVNPFGATESVPIENDYLPEQEEPVAAFDEFDAFAEKFDQAANEDAQRIDDVWGGTDKVAAFGGGGFGGSEDAFDDAFLSLREPPGVPQSTPIPLSKATSQESLTMAEESALKISNPFTEPTPLVRSESQETPPTPLFDEDVSQPLEPFPRSEYDIDYGWQMQLRQPNKKKITGQRFWKQIYITLAHQQDCVLLQLYNQKTDKEPFQELPLQPCYSVSEISAQQYDQYGKIFTLKLQYIFYKERPGVRPGQVKKAERITNKLSQFAAYAIQGDYQGVKEFGSDLRKLGLPVEHAPQVSQLMKLGSLNFEDLKQFSVVIEDALFRLQAHRDRALTYKMEEVQITLVDELYVEQTAEGHVDKQIARVRLFFLGFLSGMPDVELGVNDLRRQGKEVVGRHDIVPGVTEEWIRFEDLEFHSCVQMDAYDATHIIRFKPPDACYIELLRFRVRPPRNRELPLQLKAQICITGNRVELKADVLVPGFTSRKLGQIPCEDVMIRFPIPECWIYLFRVEKHFRYGSVKSAHRRTGKIKGIERILGTVDTMQESLIEVTSGQAKYEHQHRAIVWRCPRLPKDGQGAYTTHNMVCRLALTSYDQMPDKLAEFCYVEFTMPATQVSHMTCRSVSFQNSDSDEPPEKYVRYLARHEYRVGIEHTQGETTSAYAAATATNVKPIKEEEEEVSTKRQNVAEESSSDSD